MTYRLFALAFLTACLPAAAGEPKRLLTVDDLYRFDGPRDVAVSPDGKSAVFVRQWIDPATKAERMSLWRVPAVGEKPVPAEAGEPDARAPVYSPDGKWIAFLSTRPRPAGWKPTPPVPPESDPAVDIWLMPAAGGPPVPLAGKDKPYGRVFNDGFYGRLAFSPDGTRLAFVADDGADPRTPAEKANGVTIARDDQGEGYTGYGPAQVWVAHLDATPGSCAATRIDRLTNDDVWYGDPQWAPDGRSLVVHANRTTDRESVRFSVNKNFDLWRIDPETKALRRLTDGPGPDVSPRFSPDGKTIAYLSVPRKGSHRDTFNLMVLDPDGGSKPRVLVEHHAGPTGDVPPAPLFALPPDCWDGEDHVIYNGESGVRTEVVRLDVRTGRRTAGPAGRVELRAKFTPPGNAFLTDVARGEQKVVAWKSADGLAVEGVLTTPPAEAKAKAPYRLVVHPHGGPHGRSALGFDFTVQLFAAHGYAVFQPNFRGSSGYGQKFIDADRNDFGGGDMRDILSGVDKLVADGVADRDRLFAYGVSYGGYMTTWLVGQTDRFRAAVAQNAVTDLTMMWSLSDLQSWTEWEFGGRPWEVPDRMRKHSPLTYADRVKTPTLVLHAAADRRCPMPMGKAYHQALKARGVPTGLVVYPDEGHGIKQPRHREDVLRRVLDWFAKHTPGGGPATLPDYRAVAGWPKVPVDVKLGPVSAVATDAADRVFVAHRGPKPVLVFDRDGTFLRAWGHEAIKTPHGLRIDPAGDVWLTDIGNHLVMKFDPGGKLLLSLGTRGEAGADDARFDRPTDVAVAPTGEFYVTDGYGNARVLKYSRDGKLVTQWGKKGTGEGQFHLPHAVCLDPKGRVYVGDRENGRVQVFDADGRFLRQWKEAGAPYGLFLAGDHLFVADGRADWVKVLTLDGKAVGRFGEPGTGPDQFRLPHMLCVDSTGAVYVAEVNGKRVQKFVPHGK